MERDPKAIVRDGYDRIALTYECGWSPDPVRAKYLSLALGAKPEGAECLDLGCSTGAFATGALAERYAVVGVDISPRSIDLARAALPEVTFVVADMTELQLDEASFDLVTAFYSLVHVPSDEHGALLHAVARWLRPDGVLIASVGTPDGGASWSEDWLGAPMYWCGTTEEDATRLLRDAGLTVECVATESVDEGDRVVRHVWVVARRPPRSKS